MLTKCDMEDIYLWMRRNARELELSQFRAMYLGGDREAFLSALSDYQNPDGGFGNTIEPDNFNPNSNPYDVSNAIIRLRQVGCKLPKEHPIIKGILSYLASGADGNDDMWFFSVPSNDDYPHAVWWNYDEKGNIVESFGISIALSIFALEYADECSALYSKARHIIDSGAERIGGALGDMGLGGLCALSLYLGKYIAEVKELVDKAIVHDTSLWPTYVRRPSDFIDGPDSPFYKGNEEITERELDYLIETRPRGDVWPITWHWYDNYQKYPKAFAVGENWWKAIKVNDYLAFLRAFGRLEQ